NLNSVIATTDAKRTSIEEDLTDAQQLLNLAQTVEMSHIVEPATAGETTARSSRTSLVVGGALGPLVRVIAALLPRPLPPRRPPRRLTREGKRVPVVVPAYDEERLVVETLRGIPELVDRIYVVDDASKDATGEQAASLDDPRVEVIRHERNLGVGAAIVTGYRK